MIGKTPKENSRSGFDYTPTLAQPRGTIGPIRGRDQESTKAPEDPARTMGRFGFCAYPLAGSGPVFADWPSA
jgi:hypothetical protein